MEQTELENIMIRQEWDLHNEVKKRVSCKIDFFNLKRITMVASKIGVTGLIDPNHNYIMMKQELW